MQLIILKLQHNRRKTLLRKQTKQTNKHTRQTNKQTYKTNKQTYIHTKQTNKHSSSKHGRHTQSCDMVTHPLPLRLYYFQDGGEYDEVKKDLKLDHELCNCREIISQIKVYDEF